jgi:hypothetical protein
MSLLIPDIAGSLNSLLDASSGDQAGTGVREPWVFTSDKRRGFGRNEFVSIDPNVRRLIQMQVNPSSVKFTQPKRWVKRDTRDGSTFFHFLNKDGQNNDILTISFSGTSGYIDRRGSQPTTIHHDKILGADVDFETQNNLFNTGSIEKLIVWHNLYHLTREAMLLENGTENKFYIFYISKVFPITIRFTGFFNQVLDFSEEGAKPNSVDYSFDFTVESVQPELDTLLAQITTVLERFNQPIVQPESVLFQNQVPDDF